jgi:serine protease Do
MRSRLFIAALSAALLCAAGAGRAAEADPATEPSVLAVAKAMPAVVNINTERVVQRQVRDPFDQLFNQYFGGPTSRPLTVRQKVQSLGSGFIVDPAGYIVTNEHVVERAADLKISVTTTNGKTYTARYISGTAESDLAFIKIESPEPLPFISVTDLSPALLGQTVLVLGNPLGYGSSVARGILSAKGRSITVESAEYKNLIQTDAAINPGNSGGPLIDLAGRLVGVSSVKMAFTPQGVPTQGLGFAVAGETVREKVEEFKKALAGKTKKGAPKQVESASLARKYFGLQLQDLTPELRESFAVTGDTGVLIAEVDPGSPAAEAGIERGLVIYQVGRYQVTSSKQIEELLEAVSTGSVVDFTVGLLRRTARGQTQRQLQAVTLVAR